MWPTVWSRRGAALSLLLLFCAAALSSCASFGFNRTNLEEPIADADLAALVPGEVDLTSCLSQLGAPHLVWEYKDDGLAMAYAWFEGGGWGFTVSGGRFAPGARFSFDNESVNQNGVVLTFGSDLVLERIQRGYLRSLIPRRTPSPLPEDLEAGS